MRIKGKGRLPCPCLDNVFILLTANRWPADISCRNGMRNAFEYELTTKLHGQKLSRIFAVTDVVDSVAVSRQKMHRYCTAKNFRTKQRQRQVALALASITYLFCWQQTYDLPTYFAKSAFCNSVTFYLPNWVCAVRLRLNTQLSPRYTSICCLSSCKTTLHFNCSPSFRG